MIRTCAAVVFLAMFIAGCRTGGEDAPPEQPDTESLPPLVDDDAAPATETEAVEASATVRREGSSLIITLSDGDEVVFEDVQEGSYERDRVHRYQTFLSEIGYHMVEVRMHEGGGYLLVRDEGGHQVFVDAPPVISPDRSRLVTTSMDFVAGYAPTALRLYQITPEGVENEWAIETSEWGPSDARWLSNDRVEFIRNYPDAGGTITRRERAVLRRVGDDWVIEDAR